MKAIIFGNKGQDGQYMTKLLEENGIDVIGIDRGESFGAAGLIQYNKPDYIFHFAATSKTTHDALFENYSTIVTGTLNILEAVYQHSPKSKVFLSGSGLQFVNKGVPVHESDPFEASSAYAMSRIQSVYTARYYRTLGLNVYVGYFFNHDSPLRSSRHINQAIVQAANRGEKIEIGDITVKKEFNFAGDIVEAVWLLVNQGRVFECVIGSGKTYEIGDWVTLCFGAVGLNWVDFVSIKECYTPEYKILVSDPSTIKSLGWDPKTNIHGLSEMMLRHDELLTNKI